MINLRYGIYGRDGTLVNDGDLGALTALPVNELSDPQIVWDPGAQRFYYLVLDVARYGYAFGYSLVPNPTSPADFCKYILAGWGYASSYSLPDYPKMAVTNDFVLIGANIFFFSYFYNGSDLDWVNKPPTDSCPPTLSGGIFHALKNTDGSYTSTPVPAVSADPSATGWVVGTADPGTSSADYLSLFKVTKDAQGHASLSAPMKLTVSPYSVPASALQQGTTATLDTLDSRLEHAVAGYDPRIGATAVWTAHAVRGGAGSEERWYEISTAGAPSLSQAGKASSPTLYIWNGAVSPDRANDGSGGASFGSDMVMGFNTSSSATYPAIQMVSQRGNGAQSAFVVVKQSDGPNVDFTCSPCRWGDYSGAMPDPLLGSGGQVWLSGEWNVPATNGSNTVWRTWNWAATP